MEEQPKEPLKYNNRRDKLALASDAPDIQELVREFRRSLYNGGNTAEIAENDDLRYCKWAGQTNDGKKHSENRKNGDPALPFEGASDVRIRLIDRVINEMVSLWINSWKASKLRVSGLKVDDGMNAAAMTTLLEHVIGSKLRIEARREAELYAQYALQYGWSAMNVTWEQEIGLQPQVMRLSEIISLAQQLAQSEPENPAVRLPDAIMSGQDDEMAISMFAGVIPNASRDELQRLVTELREQGQSTIFFESIIKNLPRLTALKPYDEIAFPPETIELQKARVIFRRLYMSEVELRSFIKSDNWDSEAVEDALQTSGNLSWYTDPSIVPVANMIGSQDYRSRHLVEILYAYVKQIDENGNICIYYTAFCPNGKRNVFFKHEKLEYSHGKYPFVELRREHIRKSIMESRGIPEILVTEQAELKAQHDAFRDRTALETTPPILIKKRIQGINKIGPAMQLPVASNDDYTYLTPPRSSPNLSLELINQIEKNAANYFGLTHEAVAPQKSQMLQQMSVDGWLNTWAEIYTQLLQLCLQYMPQEELQKITGVPISIGSIDVANSFDFEVKFDVRDLDNEYVMKKLQSISQFVLPMDAGGVLDRNKLVAKLVEAISPDVAKDIILDQQSASQKMYNDIQNDVLKMMAGIEPQYVENDPAAGTKMQYLQQIAGKSPKVQQAVQGDQMTNALFQNYQKNLQMSIMQQQNKEIGRTGVTPVSDKMMQEQSQTNLNNAKAQFFNQKTEDLQQQ
jgi:hypothetical protein